MNMPSTRMPWDWIVRTISPYSPKSVRFGPRSWISAMLAGFRLSKPTSSWVHPESGHQLEQRGVLRRRRVHLRHPVDLQRRHRLEQLAEERPVQVQVVVGEEDARPRRARDRADRRDLRAHLLQRSCAGSGCRAPRRPSRTRSRANSRGRPGAARRGRRRRGSGRSAGPAGAPGRRSRRRGRAAAARPARKSRRKRGHEGSPSPATRCRRARAASSGRTVGWMPPRTVCAPAARNRSRERGTPAAPGRSSRSARRCRSARPAGSGATFSSW